jgi:hypothetical protein
MYSNSFQQGFGNQFDSFQMYTTGSSLLSRMLADLACRVAGIAVIG